MKDPQKIDPVPEDEIDIDSLLHTIDNLVIASGNTEAIEAQHVTVSGIKIHEMQDEGFTDTQLEEIEKGIAEGLTVDRYAKVEYHWMQMYELRQGLREKLDISFYESSHYSTSQMHEIRLGLLDKLDVSSYASLILSASDMQMIRKRLFASAYKENPSRFARTITDDETGLIVRINDDCMKAFVKVPDTLETEIAEEDIRHALKSHDIVYGLNDENIRKIADEKIVGREICVAQGKRPITGKDGWYELFFENCIEKGHTVPPDGEIDYTDVNTIEVVNPGDKLAIYHPSQKDTGGITVTGIDVDGIEGVELPVLTGVGFEIKEDGTLYTATEQGYASFNDSTGSLNVWKVYKFKGDVCYYQSLEYDGTVHIMGSVRTMSVVKAKGDVIIDGFVESATVYSEQNIVIKGGANGGGQGRIEAGGSIRANFFENIDVKARGMIESNYYFNANIETEDRLVARGRKARIIGGKISAALSVDAVIVGNYLSSKTLFNIGDIKSIEKHITSVAMTRKTASEELQQLLVGKEKLVLLLGEDQVIGNALYNKTCAAISTKEAQVAEADREIQRLQIVARRAEQAYIKIHGQLQSDVIFIINNIKKETPTPIDRSVFLTKKDCLNPKKKQHH